MVLVSSERVSTWASCTRRFLAASRVNSSTAVEKSSLDASSSSPPFTAASPRVSAFSSSPLSFYNGSRTKSQLHLEADLLYTMNSAEQQSAANQRCFRMMPPRCLAKTSAIMQELHHKQYFHCTSAIASSSTQRLLACKNNLRRVIW